MVVWQAARKPRKWRYNGTTTLSRQTCDVTARPYQASSKITTCNRQASRNFLLAFFPFEQTRQLADRCPPSGTIPQTENRSGANPNPIPTYTFSPAPKSAEYTASILDPPVIQTNALNSFPILLALHQAT
jgi:hypothetical protein